MFKKGDKVVYPMYGAGVIENIEENQDGKSYYNITMPDGNMKLKLSCKTAIDSGLRPIFDGDKIMKIMSDVAKKNVETQTANWNKRYKENMEKIKTGELEKVAEVVKNLNLKERKKPLSGAEKRLLTGAKQIILSEILLSKNIVKEKAEELLAKTLLNC